MLGLRPGADEEDVRRAYRELAKRLHPDRRSLDAESERRFAAITASYDVLRRAFREGSLTAGATAARRPSAEPPRRSGRPWQTPATLAELSTGEAMWVGPEAILVAPDRTVHLRPSAAGAAHPTAAWTVRVERRPDGHHVFMPPQPSTRWPVSVVAASHGIAVSVLWVGDKQESAPRASQRRAPFMPLRLLADTVGAMRAGSRAWTALEGLVMDAENTCWLDGMQPAITQPDPATPVRVVRDADGYRVHCERPAQALPRVRALDHQRHLAVTSAILDGVDVPTTRITSAPAPRPPPLAPA